MIGVEPGQHPLRLALEPGLARRLGLFLGKGGQLVEIDLAVMIGVGLLEAFLAGGLQLVGGNLSVMIGVHRGKFRRQRALVRGFRPVIGLSPGGCLRLIRRSGRRLGIGGRGIAGGLSQGRQSQTGRDGKAQSSQSESHDRVFLRL